MKQYNDIIGWWSGGVTSAITCKLLIDIYGEDRVRLIFMDTDNEDEDTYRFMLDCQKWYSKEIEFITAIGERFDSIEEIWEHYKTLNTATGAICSSTLKRDVRLQWQKDNYYSAQAFGFDVDEVKRAKSMKMNHRAAKPIFPLLMFGLNKKDCIKMLEEAEIEAPKAYKLGFHNNNCLNTGCIQGGIGYWQKMRDEHPDKFNKMAEMEHKLTNLKGKPVTMLKDQSRSAADSGNILVFLKAHPDYPELKDISMMKGHEVKPLMECNGFCGTNDLDRNPTEEEINFPQTELLF